MEKIFEQIAMMDYFALTPSLTFKQKGQFSSKIGFFSTLILGVLMVYFVIIFGSEIWQRKYPNVNTSSHAVEMPPPIQVDQKQFPFAFGMQNYDTWNHYIDESIYVPFIHFFHASKTLNETDGTYYTQIDDHVLQAVPCQKQDFQMKEIQGFIDKLELQSLYCLPHDHDLPIEISGNFDIGLYQSVVIQVRVCEETFPDLYKTDPIEALKDQPVCKKDEELSDYLTTAYFVVYFHDYSLDDSDSNRPFVPNGKSIYTTVSRKLQKEIQFQLQPIHLYSDFGVVFQEFQTQMVSSLAQWNEMYIDTGNRLLWIELSAAQEEDQYTFKYMQVQDIVAAVGGTMQIVTAIFFFFITPFIDISYQVTYINELVKKIDEGDPNNSKIDIQESSKPSIENNQTIKESPLQLQQENNQISNRTFFNHNFSGQAEPVEKDNEFNQKYLSMQQNSQSLNNNPETVNIASPQTKTNLRQVTITPVNLGEPDNESAQTYYNSQKQYSNLNSPQSQATQANKPFIVKQQQTAKIETNQQSKLMPGQSVINNDSTIKLAPQDLNSEVPRQVQNNKKIFQEAIEQDEISQEVASKVEQDLDKLKFESELEAKKPLKLNMFDYFLILLPGFKKNKKKQFFSLCEDYMDMQLDVIKMNQQNILLHQLKSLLLQGDDSELIQFSQKPTVYVPKDPIKAPYFISKTEKQTKRSQEIIRAMKRFSEINEAIECGERSFEKSILQHLDSDTVSVFKKYLPKKQNPAILVSKSIDGPAKPFFSAVRKKDQIPTKKQYQNPFEIDDIQQDDSLPVINSDVRTLNHFASNTQTDVMSQDPFAEENNNWGRNGGDFAARRSSSRLQQGHTFNVPRNEFENQFSPQMDNSNSKSQIINETGKSYDFSKTKFPVSISNKSTDLQQIDYSFKKYKELMQTKTFLRK